MYTDQETLSPLHCADLCCSSGPTGGGGNRRERTISNPQSPPSDVPRRAPFSSPFGGCQKRVTLKFDATHQLLDGQKLSMRKTTERRRRRRLREPRRKGCHRREGTDHISEAGQLSVAIPAHMQKKPKSRTCIPRPPRYLRS